MLDFTNNSLYNNVAPLESEIERETTRLVHEKTASLDGYHVKIFDTAKQSDIEEYEKLMPKLFDGVQSRRCVIWARDRALVEGSWKIYLEWSEYSIEKRNEDK